MEKIYIDVVDIVENEDGSATYTIETNEAARDLLIREGLMSILRKHMEECDGTDN